MQVVGGGIERALAWFCLLVFLAAASACTRQTADARAIEVSTPSTSSTSETVVSTTGDGDAGFSWAAQVPDWPPGYVDPGNGPYPVEGVEHVKYRIACLEYLGFAVTPTVDRLSYMFDYRGLTPEDAVAVDQECYQRAIDIGLVREYRDIPTDLSLKYETEMQTQRCLEEHGFRVVDPPTLDSYIDSGGTNWSAFDAYGGRLDVFSTEGMTLDEREWLDAEIACPPGEEIPGG